MKIFTLHVAQLLLIVESATALPNIFSRWGKEKQANPLSFIMPTQPSPMQERVDLGSLSVSPMGLGTLNLPLDKEVDDKTTGVMKMVKECGVNLVDTAEAVSLLAMKECFKIQILCLHFYFFRKQLYIQSPVWSWKVREPTTECLPKRRIVHWNPSRQSQCHFCGHQICTRPMEN